MPKPDPKRVERCLLALHDHGSREGATTHKVMKALRAENFTNDEIEAASKKMLGLDDG